MFGSSSGNVMAWSVPSLKLLLRAALKYEEHAQRRLLWIKKLTLLGPTSIRTTGLEIWLWAKLVRHKSFRAYRLTQVMVDLEQVTPLLKILRVIEAEARFSNLRLNLRRWIWDGEFETVNLRRWIWDGEFETVNLRRWIWDGEFETGMKVMRSNQAYSSKTKA